MPPPQALTIARQKGLDLVEISPTAVPPVCRIMDFGKYQYQEQKRTRESKKNQRIILVKEIKFRPKVDEHDYQFKKKHIERFLADGDKVKATIFFRGREMAHPEIGRRILERLLGELEDVAVAESMPRQEGNQMHVILGQRAGRKSPPRPKGPDAAAPDGAAPEESLEFRPHPGTTDSDARHERNDAETEDAPRRRQALQEDRNGQVHPGQRVQAPYPDQQDHQVEAAHARRQGRVRRGRRQAAPDVALQVGPGPGRHRPAAVERR
jgi:translation initiation factor IF-3